MNSTQSTIIGNNRRKNDYLFANMYRNNTSDRLKPKRNNNSVKTVFDIPSLSWLNQIVESSVVPHDNIGWRNDYKTEIVLDYNNIE